MKITRKRLRMLINEELRLTIRERRSRGKKPEETPAEATPSSERENNVWFVGDWESSDLVSRMMQKLESGRHMWFLGKDSAGNRKGVGRMESLDATAVAHSDELWEPGDVQVGVGPDAFDIIVLDSEGSPAGPAINLSLSNLSNWGSNDVQALWLNISKAWKASQ